MVKALLHHIVGTISVIFIFKHSFVVYAYFYIGSF